jgi:DNA modification methylase
VLAKQPVSRAGDLWVLGPHRLLCGDARQRCDVRKLMGGECAAMVLTDPPYNVRVSSIQGRGNIRHREFLAASGEMSREEFVRFLTDCLALAAKHSADGSIHFVFMDWRHCREMLAAGEGANTFRAGRLDELSTHPTVKPVALVADAMRDCSRRGQIVLDPFMGSGTTIMAAERVGRRAYGLELDPLYVDAAVRRWQAYTRRDAILKSTGQTFDEIAAVRGKTGGRHG